MELDIGYNSPAEAVTNGLREKLAYVTCVSVKYEETRKPDFLATVDLDPQSPTYSQIIHRLAMPNLGDELHHSGWNACSSCRNKCVSKRSKLILPAINSDRIYVVDVGSDPRKPAIFKTIEAEELHSAKAGAPHTVHCLPSGEIMVSCLGDAKGDAKGTFVLLEQGSFRVKGTWQAEEDSAEMNYDFWYQPRHDVMVSSEWAAPKIFRKGFDPSDVGKGLYGRHLNFWSWRDRKRIAQLDLGPEGQIPLEVRFKHDPASDVGFVGNALSSSIFKFHKSKGEWQAELVTKIPVKKVENWILPEMPGLITDILVSMDDKYLYVSNWLHGDIRQYDVSDADNIRQVGQIFLGGSICKGEKVTVVEDEELKEQPVRPSVKGAAVRGGPQMLQLSLDGSRLYVTNSLFSSWDRQFYPENIEKGSMMLKVNVDTKNGGLTLDQDFLVDFGSDGNVLAHEMRFPTGDSTSDIWE